MDTRFITKGSPSGALVTLAEVKARLAVADGSRDAELTRWIAAATSQIEAFSDNVILPRTITETIHKEYGGTYLVLSYSTGNTLAGLTIDSVAATLSEYVLQTTGVLMRVDGATIEPGTVVATYTAGYSTVPPDVAEAALAWCQLQDAEKSLPKGITRESVPDVGDVTYQRPGGDLAKGPTGATMPWEVASLLRPYCRTYAP